MLFLLQLVNDNRGEANPLQLGLPTVVVGLGVEVVVVVLTLDGFSEQSKSYGLGISSQK